MQISVRVFVVLIDLTWSDENHQNKSVNGHDQQANLATLACRGTLRVIVCVVKLCGGGLKYANFKVGQLLRVSDTVVGQLVHGFQFPIDFSF